MPCAGSRRWRRRRGREIMVCDEAAHRLRNAQRESQTLSALRGGQGSHARFAHRDARAEQPGRVRGGDGVRVSRLARPPRTSSTGGSLSPCAGAASPARPRATSRRRSARRARSPGSRKNACSAARRPSTPRTCRRRRRLSSSANPPAQRALSRRGRARVVREWTRGGGGGSTAAALCAIGLLRQLANSVDQAMGVGRLAALRAKAGRRRDDGEDDVAEEDETGRRKRARSEEASEDEERTLDETDVALGGSASASDASTADLRSRLASRIPKGFVGGAEGSGKLGALRSVVKALRDAGRGRARGDRIRVLRRAGPRGRGVRGPWRAYGQAGRAHASGTRARRWSRSSTRGEAGARCCSRAWRAARV